MRSTCDGLLRRVPRSAAILLSSNNPYSPPYPACHCSMEPVSRPLLVTQPHREQNWGTSCCLTWASPTVRRPSDDASRPLLAAAQRNSGSA